jgi:hypothetical protein
MLTTARTLVLLLGLAALPAVTEAKESERGEQVAPWRVWEVLTSSQWKLIPTAELAAAGYAESSELAGQAGAGLSIKQRWAGNKASYGATLEHEPFALRVFNFGDGEDSYSPERLTQSTQTVAGAMRWQKRWSETFSTDGQASVSQRWAENASDERRLTEASWAFEEREAFGLRPVSWTATARYGRSIYPQYRVNDRALDSEWGVLEVAADYRLTPKVELTAGYAVRSTQYLDAKYDAVDSNGTVITATEDKSLLRQTASVGASWKAIEGLKLTSEVELVRNDYSDYMREMDGRDASGNTEARLIRDYEDATRRLLRLGASYRPTDAWKVRFSAAGWVRSYDTYQARSADNDWLEETRLDAGVNLDLSGELALGQVVLAEAEGFAFAAVASGSYDTQSSNMKRELSFATNYAVTRLYLGVSVSGME